MDTGKSTTTSSTHAISQEYLHARSEISTDTWNLSAWTLFLEEVKAGRSNITVEEGYRQFLSQFPRAYRVHKDFAEHLKSIRRVHEAKEEYSKIYLKCKDPDVWRSYIRFVEETKDPSTSDNHKQLMDLYELAIDNIGMSVDAYPLWRDYIDLGRKQQSQYGVAVLRDIYHKALINPMDELDNVWREYEAWEKVMMNDISSSSSELLKNFNNAKAIFRDRKRYINAIDFQRIAVKPAKTLEESTQLDLWNKWIRYERMKNTNQAQLTPNEIKFIKLIFEQFLKCFLYFPEAWISYSRFASEIKNDAEALRIYEESVSYISGSAVLRISKAELEESLSKLDQAKLTLSNAFQDIPSGYTFTALQRFVRRTEGKAAGRQLFSKTIGLRKDKKQLAFEIYMAHAQTELDANFDPQVALKVLHMAKGADTSASINLRFIRLQVRCLLRIGDLNQIQWVMESSVEAISRLISKHFSFLSGSAAGTSGESGGSDQLASSGASIADGGNVDIIKLLYDKYVLCDEYLMAETTIALSDVSRLNKLRDMRDEARLQFEQYGRSELNFNSELHKYRFKSIFHASFELAERSDAMGTTLPSADEEIRERSKLVNYKHIDTLTRSQQQIISAQRELLASRASAKDRQALKEDLKEVPSSIKELLLELPVYPAAFPHPDHVYCMSLLKAAVLPASRPMLTEDTQLGKRKKDDDDDDDDDENDNCFGAAGGTNNNSKKYEDIFRIRAKARHEKSEYERHNGASISSFLV